LPVGEYVYRAVSVKGWVNKSGKPKNQAFRRRWELKESGEPYEHWDQLGLSFGLSPEDACKNLTNPLGVLKLSVERMLVRGFQFDEPIEGHVHVTNIPFYSQAHLPAEIEAANLSSAYMIECCDGYTALPSTPE
jgi:hypothetical protein